MLAQAIILNRTYFYASSRIPLSFRRLYVRIILYILPAVLFLYRSQSLLRAIRCQTSPDWFELQYGAKGKLVDMDFAGEGGWPYHASSAMLSWEPLETSCRAVNMLPVSSTQPRASGSLALLWPVFVSLAFSHFIETLACALQGVRPLQEVGMTIFEHSLAFAEAEALVKRPYFSDIVVNAKQVRNPFFAPDGKALKGAVMSGMINVPPEVLVIALISCFGHLTSNVLAIAGVRARFRFVTTATWALAFLATFVWSFANIAESGLPTGVLRIPSVCILGFVPHIVIICGICACGVIYLIAFILTLLSPPPGHPLRMTLRDRFALAYSNLQANIHLSAINPVRISWHEDFYTVILKLGYTILSAATEAVFLNEGPRVNVEVMTWLEKKRLQEYFELRRKYQQRLVERPPELQNNAVDEHGDAVVAGDNAPADASANGYARERNLRQNPSTQPVRGEDGLGAGRPRGRSLLAWHYLRGIHRLVSVVMFQLMISLARKIGFAHHIPWLRRFAALGAITPKRDAAPTAGSGEQNAILVAMDGREIKLRDGDDYDIEDLVRWKLRRQGVYEEYSAEQIDEHLDQDFYDWWKTGGAFGTKDRSGDYVPPADDDDDATSVLSHSTTTDASDWSDISDGQRTPTQARPGYYSRASTPAPDTSLDLARLAHLLDPRTAEDREEARLLARHLQSPGIMTRARFRQDLEDEKLRLLTSSRLPINLASQPQSPEEEERMLQDIILGRRDATASTSNNPQQDSGAPTAAPAGASWNTGADGMGAEGPQCVVCQVNPRVILVWPCGCLSLCDECRVAMASQNYSNCACCRAKVTAYSRLYVP